MEVIVSSAFSFLWALIILYSFIAALLLQTGKAKPCKHVGYSVYAHLVIAAGALFNGLGLNSIIGVVVILIGVYLHYKKMTKTQ